MINSTRNQKGIALVATLILLVLGVGVVAILFRLSTQETKLARLEQGYTAALDAAKGGVDLFMYLVQNGAHNPPVPSGSGSSTPFGTSPLGGQCLQVKMGNSTLNWSTNANWNSSTCGSQTQATSTNPTQSPDVTLSLVNGAITYTVNVKVIDNYLSSAVSGSQTCPNGCYYYTVLSRAQPQGSNPGEYAEIFFVYRYSQ
jgi:Tfp pilus assembly protein PilX